MKKKKIIIAIVGVIVIIAVAVSLVFVLGKDEEVKETLNKVKDKIQEKKVKIVDVNSKSRPYAVMINNLNDARAVQSGLTDAYMVYEIIVEGGITRYLALYKDANPERLGSIRSSRHYYLDYVLENDAIYVHWGWSPQAKEDIKQLGINNINGGNYDGGKFYRDNPFGLSSEHTGFTSMESLLKITEDKGYRTKTDKGLLLNYSAESIKFDETAQEANKVTIKYSNYITNYYEYDAESKLYTRYVNNSENKDYANGETIKVKNIIAYAVENYTIAGDRKNRQFLNNIGSGEGIYISEGKAVKINWKKDGRSDKTIYTLENGEELVVNDGNTFIQIYPLTGSVTME